MIKWPWENDEKPFFINEKGIHWFVDKDLTRYCSKEVVNKNPPLNAVVFLLAKKEKDRLKVITRILVDKKTNEPIHEDTSLEGMSIKIDMLRFIKSTE